MFACHQHAHKPAAHTLQQGCLAKSGVEQGGIVRVSLHSVQYPCQRLRLGSATLLVTMSMLCHISSQARDATCPVLRASMMEQGIMTADEGMHGCMLTNDR